MPTRREAIRTGLVATGALGSGALFAPPAHAFNKTAFEAKGVQDAIKALGATSLAESKDVTIQGPDIAENGAVVPVEVTSKIPGTTSIMIFVDKNQNPLIADFELSNGAEPYVSTRIKMANTSFVRVAVKAGGKAYTAGKEVKVTIGGCGG